MLDLAIPAAGVGCGIRTDMLAQLADVENSDVPFAPECLTEDYELGLKISDLGGCTRFARARAPDGRLIATRSYFPTGFYAAVRQKTRWIHGIALQGWDRMGWSANPLESWMRLRDRRGPMLALTLLLAYLLIGLVLTSWLLQAFDLAPQLELGHLLAGLLTLNIVAFLWRAVWRFAFTAREYGLRQGLLAILRIPAANVITIMAGHRAVMAYCRTFLGGRLVWEKTEHPEIRSNLDVDRKSSA